MSRLCRDHFIRGCDKERCLFLHPDPPEDEFSEFQCQDDLKHGCTDDSCFKYHKLERRNRRKFACKRSASSSDKENHKNNKKVKDNFTFKTGAKYKVTARSGVNVQARDHQYLDHQHLKRGNQDLKKQLNNMMKENKMLMKANREANAKNSELSTQIESLKSEKKKQAAVTEKQEDIKRSKEELQSFLNDACNIIGIKDSKEMTLATVLGELNEMKFNHEMIKTRLRDQEETITQLEDANKRLEAEKKSSDEFRSVADVDLKKLQMIERENNVQQSEIIELKKTNCELKKTSDENKVQLESLRGEVQNLTKESLLAAEEKSKLESIAKEKQELLVEFENLKINYQQLAEDNLQIPELVSENQQLRDSRNQLKLELESTTEKMRDKTDQLSRVTSSHTQNIKDLQAAHDHLKELEEEKEKLERQVSDLVTRNQNHLVSLALKRQDIEDKEEKYQEEISKLEVLFKNQRDKDKEDRKKLLEILLPQTTDADI